VAEQALESGGSKKNAKIVLRNPLIYMHEIKTPKKRHLSRKKLLRPPAHIRKHPLTGGAEAPTGRQTDQTETQVRRTGSEAGIKTLEISEAGRAAKLGRSQLILSLRSLKLLVSEEICGRFGSFDGSILHISRS